MILNQKFHKVLISFFINLQGSCYFYAIFNMKNLILFTNLIFLIFLNLLTLPQFFTVKLYNLLQIVTVTRFTVRWKLSRGTFL